MTINSIPRPALEFNVAAESETEISLNDRYQSGERNFSDHNFDGISLHAGCLCYANLRRSKLKQVNLSQADLRGIDLSETNLSRSDLQNADLRGSALNNAMLFMASLDGANLQGADLSGASLDISTLHQANLQGANLCGAYLCGIDLSEVNLRGAYFNEKTQFDPHFDPVIVGMQTEVNITVDDLLVHLNKLSKCTSRYLGSAMVSKYWEKSRFDNCYVADFQVDGTGQLIYNGLPMEYASFSQLKWSQLWMNKFIGSCALIFQDLPNITAQNDLLVISAG
jgi:hypothetical protein